MSKKRLEEIKQYLIHFHNAVDVKDYIKAYIFNTLKVEWLIEQAERAQELESKVKQLNRKTLILNSIKKRYKEALDIMVNHSDNPDAIKDIYYELVVKMDKLEGEE